MSCRKGFAFVLLVAIAVDTCLATHHVVDLTHEHNNQSIYWPGNEENNFTIVYRGLNTDQGFWFEMNYFGTPEHIGTHLDAPSHFSEVGLRVEQIPMKNLIGPGVIINVKNKMSCRIGFTFVLLVAIAVNTCLATHHVVDLTHEHNNQSIYWPGNEENNFTIVYRGVNADHGFWYESNYFGTPEHIGTHLDAPAHFSEGGLRVEQIPMKNLIGPGVIINVKNKVADDPDYRVTVQDLQVWETRYSRIPDGAVVLMNSGWSGNYPNKTLTFGSNLTSDPTTFHFPSFHEDAADWLIKNRKVHVIGVDTPSTDYGQSQTFPVHVLLGKASIPGVENVANLDQIPEAGTMIYVAVIKLYDGSGGPARVFATFKLDDDTSSAGRLIYSMSSWMFAFLLCFLF